MSPMIVWASLSDAFACDPALLEQSRSDLAAGKDPLVKLKKLAGSLGESCEFQPSLGDVIAIVPSSEPSGFAKLERKAVTSDPASWTAACPGGIATYDAAAAATGAERAKILYAGCDLGRFQYAAEPELASATGTVFLSVLVAKHFADHQVAPALALPLLRGLAGLSGAAAPAASTAAAATSAAAGVLPMGADPWTTARDAVGAIAGKPFDAMPRGDWTVTATRLLPLCESLRARPPAERGPNRQLEFDTCAQAGRAADNAANEAPPWFRPIGATTVNWGYYLAGATAKGDPTLIARATDDTIRGAVKWYLEQLTAGALPMP